MRFLLSFVPPFPSSLLALPDPSKDRPIGNRKKLKNKKKVLQEKQVATQSSWPLKRPTNPYSERLGFWAALGGPWPEGLAYGTDDYEDREVNCEIGDEELVKSLDHDSFGNHSMLKVFLRCWDITRECCDLVSFHAPLHVAGRVSTLPHGSTSCGWKGLYSTSWLHFMWLEGSLLYLMAPLHVATPTVQIELPKYEIIFSI